MCGIVGYIGNKEKKNIILNGLKELEYRGYDSAGMAIASGDDIGYYKAVGKLENLANKMKDYEWDLVNCELRMLCSRGGGRRYNRPRRLLVVEPGPCRA